MRKSEGQQTRRKIRTGNQEFAKFEGNPCFSGYTALDFLLLMIFGDLELLMSVL
ncbi:MAG: hypothetical protein AB9861_14010 [Methanosarcina sp.]|jgi:hypothetical protein